MSRFACAWLCTAGLVLAGCEGPHPLNRSMNRIYAGHTPDGERLFSVEYQVQTMGSGADRKILISVLPGPVKEGEQPKLRPRFWTVTLQRDSFRPSAPQNMQGRWDAATECMWLIDGKTGTPLVAVDPRSAAAMGPEDRMPAWATAAGGAALDPG